MFDRNRDFYTRGEASLYLEKIHGIRQSPASLAKLPPRKGGPAFLKDNRNVIYRRVDLDAWAASRIVEVR